MTVYNIHPTPIYHTSVKNFDKIQEELDKSIGEITFKAKSEWGMTHYLSTVDFKDNFLLNSNNNFLVNEIDYNLKNYLNDIGSEKFDKYKIHESWMSLFKTGNYGHVHSHGTSDVSGVYYYKTNGNDGEIFFEPQNSNLTSTICYKHLGNFIDIKPKEGDLILFPGWLRHGIRTNTTDNTRISVSFNIFFPRA